MSVPSYQALMRPVLEVLGELGSQSFQALVEQVADRMGVTEEDRTAALDSGQTRLSNRVGWSISYLVQAEAVRRSRRGAAEITDGGRKLLATIEGPIGKKDLEQFEEFRDFQGRTHTQRSAQRGTVPAQVELDDGAASEDEALSPREVIETAAKDHRAATTGDPLGLDRIYVQAKRYARDRTVGRPLMQEFVGALHGQQADRGVFMTTCTFTRDALDYAERVGARIIPVDGEEMAALLLRRGVGVRPYYTAVLHRLDEEFFETLEG